MLQIADRIRQAKKTGFTSALYLRHQDALHTANQKMMKLVSTFIVICCLLVLLFSLLSDGPTSFPLPVLLYLLLTLSLYSLMPRPDTPPTKRTTILLFSSLCVSLVYGMITAVWMDPTQSPLLLCVLLATVPTLISAPYWQTILPTLAAELLFIPAALCWMPPAALAYALKWTICCTCVGLILGRHHTVTKMREFLLSEQLCRQRDTDALTNLLTRGAAESHIRSLLELGDTPCTIMIMDIDNFKSMNDTYGHSYGDAILECLADLLSESFRTTDYVCRLGGDEFMVLVRGNADPEVAVTKAKKLLADLAATPTPGGKNLHPTISIGLALFPQHGTSFDELYRRADSALYQAKHSGKNTYRLFNT